MCRACVICTNAPNNSSTVHLVKDEKRVAAGGLSELNRKDILMDIPFAGCSAAADKVCRVTAADIEDGEWKETDPANSQGDEKIIKNFNDWKKTLEKATGQTYTNEEYLQRYEELYWALGNHGDFGHMMYTIAANLIDEGNKVDNKWNNIGAKETSWKNADTRKDIAGWLGDAVYDGSEKRVSFGEDDYIADLDSDNISYNMGDDTELMQIMNQYYEALMASSEDYRTKTFVENNTYAAVEKTILDRIGVKDKNKDGVKDYKDLEGNDVYKDTYEFLQRLKPYDTAE